MSASKNSVTTKFVANIIYSIKPTIYKTFLLGELIHNFITMLGTRLLQFSFQPLFIYGVHSLICLISNKTIFN